MAKAVLISIHPQWCEPITQKIGELKNCTPIYKKRVEIRKSKPKLNTPFKVYIYCTKDKKNAFYPPLTQELLNRQPKDYVVDSSGNGKVIGEFVCDGFYTFFPYGLGIAIYDAQENIVEPQDMLEWSCLTEDQLVDYVGNKECYGWHISNLVIYDEPKELSEFSSGSSVFTFDDKGKIVYSGMKRPPQSWCYVEELSE